MNFSRNVLVSKRNEWRSKLIPNFKRYLTFEIRINNFIVAEIINPDSAEDQLNSPSLKIDFLNLVEFS
jgi:hypothetical protein